MIDDITGVSTDKTDGRACQKKNNNNIEIALTTDFTDGIELVGCHVNPCPC